MNHPIYSPDICLVLAHCRILTTLLPYRVIHAYMCARACASVGFVEDLVDRVASVVSHTTLPVSPLLAPALLVRHTQIFLIVLGGTIRLHPLCVLTNQQAHPHRCEKNLKQNSKAPNDFHFS